MRIEKHGVSFIFNAIEAVIHTISYLFLAVANRKITHTSTLHRIMSLESYIRVMFFLQATLDLRCTNPCISASDVGLNYQIAAGISTMDSAFAQMQPAVMCVQASIW